MNRKKYKLPRSWLKITIFLVSCCLNCFMRKFKSNLVNYVIRKTTEIKLL